MRTEAQKSPSGLPVSKLGDFPWNFQTSPGAKQACADLGTGYHLLSSSEWMTIAADILKTPINDLSSEPGPQLTNGNTAGQKFVQAVPDVSPSLAKCNLSSGLDTPENASCSLRSNLSYTGTAGNWVTPYVPGEPSRSLSRTTVLSNGEVLWDLTGNLWEWMSDPYIFEEKTGTGETFEIDSDGLTGNGIKATFPITKTRWIEYNEVKDYGKMDGSQLPDSTLTSVNGIGKISLNPGWSWEYNNLITPTSPFKAVTRGGAWANNENSGIYSLDLALGPSYNRNYTGFRCAKSLK